MGCCCRFMPYLYGHVDVGVDVVGGATMLVVIVVVVVRCSPLTCCCWFRLSNVVGLLIVARMIRVVPGTCRAVQTSRSGTS